MNMDRGNSIVSELGSQRVVALPTDVSSETDVRNCISTAVSKFGGLHGAINCAGIAIAQKVLSKKGVHGLADFERVIKVNLTGTFNVCRLAAERMASQEPYSADGERGVLICTASVAGLEGQIGQASYASSKGGVIALTLPLARELASSGIRVMTLAPGIFQTPMMAGLPEKAQKELAAGVPFPKRLGDPKEFAAMVSHILENPMLNGTVIRIDGSIRMP